MYSKLKKEIRECIEEALTKLRVKIDDALLAEKRVSILMGDNVEPRKAWIEENVVFSLEDDYKI